MRKHNELARALTELPDELLLEAENAGRRRKPGKLRRIAAAAAIVALLATTVGAAAMGITLLLWVWDADTSAEVPLMLSMEMTL